MFQQFRNLFIGKGRPFVFGLFGIITVPTYKAVEYYNIKKIEEYPSYFKNIWRIFLTEKTCISAVMTDPYILTIMPNNLKTETVCMKAVERDLDMFEYVPKNNRTKKMSKYVIDRKPKLFKFVPKEVKTRRMCELVVAYEPSMFIYVPDDLKSQKMCTEVFNKNRLMFFDIPKNLLTEQMCKEILEVDYRYFDRIPDICKTKEMCESMVKKNVNMFQYVPDKFKSYAMCEEVIMKNCDMLRYVPPDKKSDNMIGYCATKTNDLNIFVHTKMDGKKFNKYFGNRAFVKLSNIVKDNSGNEVEVEENKGYILKTGLNIDNCPCMCEGGLQFIENHKLNYLGRYVKFYRSVTIPDDAIVQINFDGIESTKLILKERNDNIFYDPNYVDPNYYYYP